MDIPAILAFSAWRYGLKRVRTPLTLGIGYRGLAFHAHNGISRLDFALGGFICTISRNEGCKKQVFLCIVSIIIVISQAPLSVFSKNMDGRSRVLKSEKALTASKN
jgi:hypothetical protein